MLLSLLHFRPASNCLCSFNRSGNRGNAATRRCIYHDAQFKGKVRCPPVAGGKFRSKTPYDLLGVADGIKQLLAYGTAAEDAIETVEMLGNVSAGLSVPLGDMVYLYGTLKSQGRAMLVDIRQFAGRGVPIYEELAKVLGVSVSEVNKYISAGKVGFPEVEQAFKI